MMQVGLQINLTHKLHAWKRKRTAEHCTTRAWRITMHTPAHMSIFESFSTLARETDFTALLFSVYFLKLAVLVILVLSHAKRGPFT